MLTQSLKFVVVVVVLYPYLLDCFGPDTNHEGVRSTELKEGGFTNFKDTTSC